MRPGSRDADPRSSPVWKAYLPQMAPAFDAKLGNRPLLRSLSIGTLDAHSAPQYHRVSLAVVGDDDGTPSSQLDSTCKQMNYDGVRPVKRVSLRTSRNGQRLDCFLIAGKLSGTLEESSRQGSC